MVRNPLMQNNPITLAAIFGALCTLLMHTPAAFRTDLGVLVFFVALDTITGLLTALVCRAASSHKLRTQLISKSVQYAIFVGACGGVSVLLGSWVVACWGAFALIAIEFQSLLENLARLQEHGGFRLGPLAKAVSLMSAFFSVTAPVSISNKNNNLENER
jgi:phage-related holin